MNFHRYIHDKNKAWLFQNVLEFGKLQFTDYICYNNDIRTIRIVKLTVKLDSQLFHKTFSITDLIT